MRKRRDTAADEINVIATDSEMKHSDWQQQAKYLPFGIFSCVCYETFLSQSTRLVGIFVLFIDLHLLRRIGVDSGQSGLNITTAIVIMILCLFLFAAQRSPHIIIHNATNNKMEKVGHSSHDAVANQHRQVH